MENDKLAATRKRQCTAFAISSLYFNRVLKFETRFMFASLVLQVLVCKIARQKHPFYFEGELVADIARYRQ